MFGHVTGVHKDVGTVLGADYQVGVVLPLRVHIKHGLTVPISEAELL